MRVAGGQPAVVNNDWTILEPPALGRWSPQLAVSVIVPAYNPRHLPHVLAGLAAQSYPAHLMEVVVVDDGSVPAVQLPEVRPENTRLVRTEDGWGRASTCHTGVVRSEGEVLHWLDSDMVPCREEVEAHLRWHHLVDYAAVLGTRQFTDDEALSTVDPARLREGIAAGRHPRDLMSASVEDSAWTETILHETGDLARAGFRAMRLHVGASGSVGRDLYEASGGMPVGLALGEDIVLGYRLREAGAVFIPDRAASSLHPGSSGIGQRAEDTNRYNRPFFADLVPEFRGHRLRVRRSFTVPYAEVVAPVVEATLEQVTALVDAQLDCSLPDVVVTLVAPWSTLSDERRRALDDEHRELRMVQAAYRAETRVRFVDRLSPLSEATFRLVLPQVDRFPTGRVLERTIREMEDDHLGHVEIDLGAEGVARLERTASVARAQRLSENVDVDATLLSDVTLSRKHDGSGFVSADEAPQIKQVRGLVPWGVQPRRREDPARES